MKKNMAVVEFSFNALEHLLGLPEGHKIIASYSGADSESILLRVEGPQLPAVAHGEKLQKVIFLSTDNRIGKWEI